jgi:hypothetical protein
MTKAKLWMLGLTLLLSFAWAQAQTSQSDSSTNGQTSGSDNGQQSQMGSQSGMQGGKTSVQGCLQGSNGTYTITDDAGTMYQLSGDTSKLSAHVGHEVQITGTVSGNGSNAMSGGSSSGGSSGSQTLQIEKVKHIAKTCKTGKT